MSPTGFGQPGRGVHQLKMGPAAPPRPHAVPATYSRHCRVRCRAVHRVTCSRSLGRAPGAGGALRVAGPGVRPWTCRRRRPRRYRGSQAPRPRPGRRARCRRACGASRSPRVAEIEGEGAASHGPRGSRRVPRPVKGGCSPGPPAAPAVAPRPGPGRRSGPRQASSCAAFDFFLLTGRIQHASRRRERPAGPLPIGATHHSNRQALCHQSVHRGASLLRAVCGAIEERPGGAAVQSAAPPGLPEVIVHLVALLTWRGLSWKPERSSHSVAVRRALTKL
ncbi:hypothetical protein EES39_10270 [Streptomyces sp. ADI92-24]|nr:hypothetical protein EDD95_0661 [Streptomyces sp. CEV 2-1]RPK48529.1 hypothetical protein EES39_10270 [Streptomyces sp. ADI92-24]